MIREEKKMVVKKKFFVEGMRCAACSSAVERKASKVSNVLSAKVDLSSNTLFIEAEIRENGDKEHLSKAILDAIADKTITPDLAAEKENAQPVTCSEFGKILLSKVQ